MIRLRSGPSNRAIVGTQSNPFRLGDVKEDRLVYSTDAGRVGADRRPKKPPAGPVMPADGVVRIFRERGQRGGKIVTIIRGLPDRGVELDARAGELKRLCGAGGTVRGDAIEIQGDHRERIADRLRALGYRVKLAGG